MHMHTGTASTKDFDHAWRLHRVTEKFFIPRFSGWWPLVVRGSPAAASKVRRSFPGRCCCRQGHRQQRQPVTCWCYCFSPPCKSHPQHRRNAHVFCMHRSTCSRSRYGDVFPTSPPETIVSAKMAGPERCDTDASSQLERQSD